jgi:hypothetical protein
MAEIMTLADLFRVLEDDIDAIKHGQLRELQIDVSSYLWIEW